MGRFKSRFSTVRKRKEDTPRKTPIIRKIASKKRTLCKGLETLPEHGTFHIDPVEKVKPVLVKPGGCEFGAESSGERSPMSLVIDTSCSDNDDSSVFTSSCSSPSPDPFREEHLVEQYTLRQDDELPDLHFLTKNSTLLEHSGAETILTYHPPNLSTIIDAPSILAEKSNLDMSQDMRVNKTPTDGYPLIPVPPSGKASETSHVHSKPLLKKQVWFRSPLFSERSIKENHTTPHKKIRYRKIIPKRLSASPCIRPTNTEPDASQTDENDTVDSGVFFDFDHDFQCVQYFQEMRKRCTNLKNAPAFPLSAVK